MRGLCDVVGFILGVIPAAYLVVIGFISVPVAKRLAGTIIARRPFRREDDYN